MLSEVGTKPHGRGGRIKSERDGIGTEQTGSLCVILSGWRWRLRSSRLNFTRLPLNCSFGASTLHKGFDLHNECRKGYVVSLCQNGAMKLEEVSLLHLWDVQSD